MTEARYIVGDARQALAELPFGRQQADIHETLAAIEASIPWGDLDTFEPDGTTSHAA